MKIFIGTHEIASILKELSNGFKTLGHEVTSYVSFKNIFYKKFRYDIERGNLINGIIKYTSWKILPSRVKTYCTLIDARISVPYLKMRNRKIIKDHDVFVFIWRPWLDESWIFPILKKKNKKIIWCARRA